MEQKQTNSDWENRKEVKKGNIGEDIVMNYLHSNGFVLYKPITDGSHKIDYFCHSGKDKQVICAEAKTKRRMALRPATGFNIDSYNHYIEMKSKHNINTFIFFIDDFEKCVYGQWLHLLGDGIKIKEVIVWPLEKMKWIRSLNNIELKIISENTTVRYNYSKTVKYFSEFNIS